jgi:ParB family transcriptional regulator, chromosome partitioning protein
VTQVQRRNGGLGRGLAALIPQRPDAGPQAQIPISRVTRNPYQPRQQMDREALEALAESIRRHGVIQPILVTETAEGYQLVAGERRLQAAEMAGLQVIPAVVRHAVPREQLELALVENIQRADLNPMEEAHAYRQLIDEFGLSHEELAARVGRNRSTISNTLRLLQLPEPVRRAVAEGSISEGHARAIGGLDENRAQEELLSVVVARGVSVRETEELARRLRERPPAAAATPAVPASDPDIDALEAELRAALGTKVTVSTSRRGGRIVIEYYDRDDLGRLCERLLESGR